MLQINMTLRPTDLRLEIERMWALSAHKLDVLHRYDPARGAPVFTVRGRYTARGWTEWTQGFVYGSAILQYDATGNEHWRDWGRAETVARMAGHVTHRGVHDHGFNNVSTYGNLLRLMNEGRIPENEWERAVYVLALKASGAVQAMRWTRIGDDAGFIHSFNGPHSLFADTVRSLRALALAHELGHTLMDENDRRVSLLGRLIEHARTTARYAVYYGKGRDTYDVRGRVAQESIFNIVDGIYRCPNSQQGYSPFTTWTRGLAWILCGYPEQLEYLDTLPAETLAPWGGRVAVRSWMLDAARATADYYIEIAARDGVPYWDTGAPGLAQMPDALAQPSDPFNDHEPVDSSAAAIAAQGLLRLSHLLERHGGRNAAAGRRYRQAGLTVLRTLLNEPYLSTTAKHEGLLLHSVYHRPNGWDYVPRGRMAPCGESSMWGDYHLREAALYAQRMDTAAPYLAFYGAGMRLNTKGDRI